MASPTDPARREQEGRSAPGPGRGPLKVVLPARGVALRPVDPAAGAGTPPAAAARASTAAPLALSFDVKAMQRKAYERGIEVERARARAAVDAAVAEVKDAALKLRGARARDREELESFGLRLACIVAEELVARVIDADAHDVKAMVRRVLDVALPELDKGPLVLAGHPDDLVLLPPRFEAGPDGLEIRLLPDPALPRGTFRLAAGDSEYYSGLSERLEGIKDALLRGVEAGPPRGGNDAP